MPVQSGYWRTKGSLIIGLIPIRNTNNQIETTNFKPDILVFVARQYLGRGEREKAIALLRKAFGASRRVTALNLQQFARSDVALLLAKAGQYD